MVGQKLLVRSANSEPEVHVRQGHFSIAADCYGRVGRGVHHLTIEQGHQAFQVSELARGDAIEIMTSASLPVFTIVP